MSGQALDLRRSARIVRRYRGLVGSLAVLGLLAGIGYALLNPPMLTSSALVVLPASNKTISTYVVIATSDPVLSAALPQAGHGQTLATLRPSITVKSLTGNVLSISGQGATATQARAATNAVASSFISYIQSGQSAAGAIKAKLLASAASATGPSMAARLATAGLLGLVAGALIGAVASLARGRSDRRLRDRYEIADAIGAPVVASIAAGHPADPAGWTKLLDEYEPGAVQAWSLRRALSQLGLIDLDLNHPAGQDGSSIAVLSLSADRTALAVGPQLAVFAAALGVPTTLLIDPQQDEHATASLRAACRGLLAERSGDPGQEPGQLRVAVTDREGIEQQPGGLKVIVAVVDGQAPKVAETIRGDVTVLGVSAGTATAEQLARVAVSAAASGRDIAGIIVADPEPDDKTTGRLPQPARPPGRRQPTRLTGTTTETRR
jgi:capsular polysaccharide biosynthesis protein